jgi:CII-binding regulator of phage lambda lysogenization HflD
MSWGKRKADRVHFQRAHQANLMAVDGTWRRSCLLHDISSTGARIEVEGTTDVLQVQEFFLMLSSTGLAYRRCELVWMNGAVVGVHFISNKPKPKKERA